MAKATRVIPIIRPAPKLSAIADNMSTAGQRFASGSYSWYNQLIQSAHQRLVRYTDYDRMDDDGDVSRALDVIADEMVGSLEMGSSHQFLLDVIDDELPSTTLEILQTALRIWVESTGIDTKMFYIARNMIKYGDCFFLKPHPNSKWTHIHPRLIISAITDERDGTTPLGWNVKPDSHSVLKRILGTETTSTFYAGTTADQQVSAISASQVVRFSTTDEMAETAPFGESLLKPAVLAFKQKQLIEDAVIIYRVQRAPERRVFYIDMGNTPVPLRAQLLEQIKTEIKQKKVPRPTGSSDPSAAYDKVYDPLSTNEDYFFPISSDARGSRVETLPGGANVGEVSDLTEWRRAVWRALKIPYSYIEDGSDSQGIINDGKSGVAYIQELKFNLMVQRLQQQINSVLDREFKSYLKHNDIVVDGSRFKVRLPAPQNFAAYRQQAVDAELLNNYSSVEGIPYMAKEFVMSRFLMLTQEEIIENGRKLKMQLGLDPDDESIPVELLYVDEYREAIIADRAKSLILTPKELSIEDIDSVGGGDGSSFDEFGDDFGMDGPGGGIDVGGDSFGDDLGGEIGGEPGDIGGPDTGEPAPEPPETPPTP